MKNTKTFNLPATNRTGYQEALSMLESKINEVNKQISYLDVYNIVAVCENKDTFASQVNALTANSSMVINTEGFYWNEERYETGDIILKIANGTPIHIKAQTGGIYYPSKITKLEDDPNYTLTYVYSPVKPTSIDAKMKENATNEVQELGQNINFTLQESNQSSVYGLWRSFELEETVKNEEGVDVTIKTYGIFPAQLQNNDVVQPYVKFYLCNNAGQPQDEIIVDYTWAAIDNKKNIQIILPDEGSDSMNITNLYMKVK